ncbi:MAG: DUF6632 domain-containing protein, partial [Lysobacterales bacterium]
ATSTLMRVVGWGLIPALMVFLVSYPHGFVWGIEEGTQYHPYLWMMLMLYIAWCYLLVREAKNPRDAGLLFDFGIIANLLHALLMIGQTLMMWEHEMPHMWADIPILFVLVYLLWRYHPKNIKSEN